MRKTILAILLVMSFAKPLEQCQWKDNQGYVYDLKGLDKPSGWQLKDDDSGMGMFSMVYVFNFCDFSKIRCHDRQVGVYEALAVMGQMTENCDVVGSHETKAVTHLDEQNPERGLKVTFNLGDLCLDIEPSNALQPPKQGGAMQPRQAIFEIECPTNGREDSDFTVVPGNDCIDQFRIKKKVACRGGAGESWISWLIKWIVLLYLIFIVGMFFLNKRKGLEGTDAIPHYDFWLQLANYSRDQLQSVLEFIKHRTGRLRGSQGYSTV